MWRLKRTSAVKRERREEEVEDSENGLSSDEDTDQREEKRVKKERSASVASTGAGGKKGKPPIPSAGWPAKQNLDDGRPSKKHRRVKTEEEKIIGKGKERAKKEENQVQSTGEESESSSSENSEEEAENRTAAAAGPSASVSLPKGFTDPGTHIDGTLLSEREQLGRLLAHFESSEKGQKFLTTQSYRSLLSSMFAQYSADLAKSLHWWTKAQADIKARHFDPSTCSDADWHRLSYLEELLAENAYTWDLWPRLPAYTENDSLHSIATRGPAVDMEPNMAEEIAGIALRQLADSSLFKDLDFSLSPLHLEALISSHTKRGLPFSTRRHRTIQPGASTYATPEISEAGYRAKYLNREDVLLDHVEAIRVPLITQTMEILDRVLMTVAENRKVQAFRRHRPHSVQRTVQPDKEQEPKQMSEVKKGKQRAVAQHEDISAAAVEEERSKVAQDKQRTVGEEDQVSAPFEEELPDEVREGEHRAVAQGVDIPEPAEEEWSEVRKGKRRAVDQDVEPWDEEPAEPSKRKKPKKKERMPPGDSKAVLLAAASVPGMPRRCA